MVEQIVWTSADGSTSIDLTDDAAGYTVNAAGTAGLRSVGYELTTTRYAGVDGETVNAIHAIPNTPTLGLTLEADGEAELRAKVRGLVHAMRPKAGLGQLTVTNEFGEFRTLNCYCTEGLSGAEDPNSTLPGSWWRAALKFYAPDPWWVGAARTVSLGLAAGGNFFPIFPLTPAPSSVQGQFTVNLSDSDAPAYPVWTITGPGSGLVLTNQTTGMSLSLGATLAGGESMTIDTRPTSRSIRKNDGTNLLPTVTSGTYPALWPLIEGVNTVTAALTGATSASRIAGTYQPRYAGI